MAHLRPPTGLCKGQGAVLRGSGPGQQGLALMGKEGRPLPHISRRLGSHSLRLWDVTCLTWQLRVRVLEVLGSLGQPGRRLAVLCHPDRAGPRSEGRRLPLLAALGRGDDGPSDPVLWPSLHLGKWSPWPQVPGGLVEWQGPVIFFPAEIIPGDACRATHAWRCPCIWVLKCSPGC